MIQSPKSQSFLRYDTLTFKSATLLLLRLFCKIQRPESQSFLTYDTLFFKSTTLLLLRLFLQDPKAQVSIILEI